MSISIMKVFVILLFFSLNILNNIVFSSIKYTYSQLEFENHDTYLILINKDLIIDLRFIQFALN